MPRIPVRTTPYKDVAPCTRHFKSKRDLTLKGLGKSTFINASQFLLITISPKGDVETHASELLQAYLNPRDLNAPCVINWSVLNKAAPVIKEQIRAHWATLKRQESLEQARVKDEEDGFIDVEEDEEEEEEEDEEDTKDVNFDPDQTLVGSDIDLSSINNDKPAAGRPTVNKKGLKRPIATANSSTLTSRVTTPEPPLHEVLVTLGQVEQYYESRFNTAQQNLCKLVAKSWIKVIEPKKQVKYPYNQGAASRPAWWPSHIQHREPDHINKNDRVALLIAILRHPSICIEQLELANATQGYQIEANRHSILRELYLVAREERRLLAKGAGPETIIKVYLQNPQVTGAEMTPDLPEKRTHSAREEQENQVPMDIKQGHYAFIDPSSDRVVKRSKTATRPPPIEIVPLHTNSYEMQHWSQMANTQHQHHQQQTGPMVGPWRDSLGLSVPPPHLSPYPHGEYTSTPPIDYARLPVQGYEMHPHVQIDQSKYGAHLAPMMTQSMSGTSSPVDTYSPALGSQGQAGYFPRTHSASSVGVMQPQQTDYYQHQHQYHQQHQLQMQQQFHMQQQQQLHEQQHHQLQHAQGQAQGQGHPLHQMTQAQPEVSAPPPIQPQAHQMQPQLSQSSNFNYGSPFIGDWIDTDLSA